MKNIPTYVAKTIKTLENAGFEAYIVGGSVRDMLQGLTPKDFDITTSALPSDVKRLFPKTVDIGIKHGTVSVIAKGGKIEVTTFRIDGDYVNHRKPKTVDFTSDIYEDLSRRDFTINAIAHNPSKGFLDPHGGIEDINIKLIRCVGSAERRFGEDALRMLRAVRFAATLGFKVDDEICSALRKHRDKLNAVSAERICEEFTKLVLGSYPEAFYILDKTGFFPYVLRGGSFTYHSTDLQKNAGTQMPVLVERMKKCPADIHMRLALMFDCICKNYEDVLCSLKFDNRTKKIVSIYMSNMHVPIGCTKYEIKKTLRHVPDTLFDNLLVLKQITGTGEPQDIIMRLKNEIIQTGECYKMEHLAVKGNDLMKNGIKPGPGMGTLLEELLDLVIKNPELNEKEKLLKFIPGC